MEMDASAAALASVSTALASSTIDPVAQSFAQTTAATATVLARGKKEITVEARATESKKRAARRVVAKQREKDKKLAEEKASRLPSTLLPCSRARW
jgi:hypothetical protein